jgi:hypothetical protein
MTVFYWGMIWNRFQMGRRNLGTFASKQAAKKHERSVQFFNHMIHYGRSGTGALARRWLELTRVITRLRSRLGGEVAPRAAANERKSAPDAEIDGAEFSWRAPLTAPLAAVIGQFILHYKSLIIRSPRRRWPAAFPGW